MDIIYNVVIPLITSILGGLTGGLFTYLGVKITIRNDNKLKKLEIQEQNKEKNTKIILDRPEFEVVQNEQIVQHKMKTFVLPYIKPKLINEKDIHFEYDKLNLSDEFWDFKEITICNSGKTTIENGFLQLKYKSGVNIYSEQELYYLKGYDLSGNYSDTQRLPNWIKPQECVKLKIYYPKETKELSDICFNCYMVDENGNVWYQDFVNKKSNGNESTFVSPKEYTMYYKNKYNKFCIFDSLFYDQSVEKCFDTKGFEKVLQQRKEKFYKQEDENEKFKMAVRNGEILLKSYIQRLD